MTEHTPGPLDAHEHGSRGSDGPTAYRISTIDKPAVILGYTAGYSGTDGANATLWAAAPDLLEALEGLAGAVLLHLTRNESHLDLAFNKAQAVIAKATGQTFGVKS